MKAIRLRTADLREAIGIDVKNPRLSWNCSIVGEGKYQASYQVTAMDADGEILFDTGRVESSSMYCDYAGAALNSRQRVVWSVCLWDETGTGEWSEETFFEMGLLEKSDWQAKWICGVGTDREERLPADYYHRGFTLGKGIKAARLYATALGVYTAKINGKLVSSVLAPGSTQYDKRLYYQTYDVTGQLREGEENQILLTVGDGWYKGKLGADQNQYIFGTQTKVLAQLEITYKTGEKEVICTGDTFFWSNDGPVRFADLKDGEIYDARRQPEFKEHAVIAREERRIPTASNAPLIREHEVFPARLEISPSGSFILNFGQNIAGYVRFRAHAPEGAGITLRLFEAEDHGEYSDISLSFPAGGVEPVKQEIRYISSGKDELFCPEFFYSGFQYALVEGLEEVDAADFEAVAVYSDLEFGSSFACSNGMVNQFLNNTVWSMKGNFVDVPTDCPQREKAGWTGDAQVFCRTAAYLADTKAFYRKWLKDVRDCQREDGVVENVSPRVAKPGNRMEKLSGSMGWADAAVIIPYTLWKQTGDSSWLFDHYELMRDWKKYVMALCQDKSMFSLPEGDPMYMISQLYQGHRLKDSQWNRYIPEAGIHWGEWCVPQSQEPDEDNSGMSLVLPKQEVTCAYTHYSMGLLEEMLTAMGREDEAAECREYAEGSKEAYHVHWVKNDRIETNRMAELVRPIALGLLNGEERKNAAADLNAMAIRRNYKVGTGFLSTPFLLQVLAENGYTDTAYRMLENQEAPSWLAMVAQGATTVWEEYECYDGEGKPLAHSFNHYSPGAVCAFLFDTVCGIRITGENHILIRPQPGGTLTWAEARVLTAYGEVYSRWEKVNGKITYTIQIPANVTGTVVLPDGTCRELPPGKYSYKEGDNMEIHEAAEADGKKKQIYNPFLPLNEYIPDGEPHVFGDRVYLFGSHDKEGGDEYCMLDYAGYSAPVTDLKDWRYEGIIYKAEQDPDYSEERKYMYAPDAVRGNDGRYYLYYCLVGGEDCISVAVCETPAGKYEYHGKVRNSDGSRLKRFVPGDPAVINDNGTIRLYYGWALAVPESNIPAVPEEEFREKTIQAQMMLFKKSREEIVNEPEGVMGANTVTLKDDMLTTASEPVRIVPGQFAAKGTSFEGHAFYEASSIRKIGELYYFIYSSQWNHELCYATSRYPDRDFVYGGTIISNGDIGYQGRKPEERLNLTGTNHGSIECINGKWYVFYHRSTHATEFSRQACAEQIQILQDGTIPQVEVTSCGLNGGPLLARGEYPAAIACNITNGRMPHIQFEKTAGDVPCVTHSGGERYITGIQDQTLIGYKYFKFDGAVQLTLKVRSTEEGKIVVSDGKQVLGELTVLQTEEWRETTAVIEAYGIAPLYLTYQGRGTVDFISYSFLPLYSVGDIPTSCLNCLPK